MLNRRKQLHDIADSDLNNERQTLLENPFHHIDNNPVNNNNNHQGIQVIHRSTATNIHQHGPSSIVPLPIPKKARDKSPEPSTSLYKLTSRYPSNNLVANNQFELTSSSASIPIHQQYGESYDIGISGNNSYSKAIDISNIESCTSRHNISQTDFIYYTVQPGDTLQNLSVRYSCPVASIKRLNNLWSDQEFYGLSRIKLPAGKLRLIADVINEDHMRSHHTTAKETEPPVVHPTPTLGTFNQLEERSLEEIHSNQSQTYIAKREFYPTNDIDLLNSGGGDSIFKNLDLNIERARTAARFYNDNASAIMQSLAQGGNLVDYDDDDLNNPNKIAQREAETLLNDMSDYGLSYNGLILFIFIVCLICPLAYVIYLEETAHDNNKAS